MFQRISENCLGPRIKGILGMWFLCGCWCKAVNPHIKVPVLQTIPPTPRHACRPAGSPIPEVTEHFSQQEGSSGGYHAQLPNTLRGRMNRCPKPQQIREIPSFCHALNTWSWVTEREPQREGDRLLGPSCWHKRRSGSDPVTCAMVDSSL